MTMINNSGITGGMRVSSPVPAPLPVPTRAQFEGARDWIADAFLPPELDAAELHSVYDQDAAFVQRFTNRHYSGGWAAFVADFAPVTVDLKRHCAREDATCVGNVHRLVLGKYSTGQAWGRALCRRHVSAECDATGANFAEYRNPFILEAREWAAELKYLTER